MPINEIGAYGVPVAASMPWIKRGLLWLRSKVS